MYIACPIIIAVCKKLLIKTTGTTSPAINATVNTMDNCPVRTPLDTLNFRLYTVQDYWFDGIASSALQAYGYYLATRVYDMFQPILAFD